MVQLEVQDMSANSVIILVVMEDLEVAEWGIVKEEEVVVLLVDLQISQRYRILALKATLALHYQILIVTRTPTK